MFNKLVGTLISAVLIIGLIPDKTHAFIPLPDADGQYTVDEKGNLTVAQMSIGDFPSFTKEGSFQSNPQLNRLLKYDPSRTWSVGDRPEDVLTYGDFKDYGLHNLTLQQLNPDVDLATVSLEEVDILDGRSLTELVKTVPKLRQKRVKDIPPLRDILPRSLHRYHLSRIIEKNGSLLKDVRRDAEAEVKQVAQQVINQQQVKIYDGLNEGVDLISQRVVDNYTQKYPDIASLDLDLIKANAKQKVQQKLVIFTSQASQKITSNFGLDNAQSYLDVQLNQYINQVNNLTELVAQDLNQDIQQQIGDRYKKAGLGQIFALSIDVSDINNAVRDYGQEIINETKVAIKKEVNQKVEQLEEFRRTTSDDIGDIKLSNYDLSEYSVEDIPGLKDTQVEKFNNYEQAAISEVPGAENLSFDRFPTRFNFGAGFGTIDWVFSEAEGYADRAISGSIKETFNLAHCGSHNSLNGGCAHIEMVTPEGLGFLSFNGGKQWVSGDSQKTKGGRNLLQKYKGGKEPTGRLPAPESLFKMVLRNNDELKDTTELYLAYQFCFTDIFGTRHCTPHNVFEFYLMTFGVGDLIYLGISPI